MPVSKPPKKTKKKLEGQRLTLMEIIYGKSFDITKCDLVDTSETRTNLTTHLSR